MKVAYSAESRSIANSSMKRIATVEIALGFRGIRFDEYVIVPVLRPPNIIGITDSLIKIVRIQFARSGIATVIPSTVRVIWQAIKIPLISHKKTVMWSVL